MDCKFCNETMTLEDSDFCCDNCGATYAALIDAWTDPVVPEPVDLRTCKEGDKLVSKHGMILTYVKPLPEEDYMDHEVAYPDGGRGTRTHDGRTYRNRPLPIDHDIVEIRRT
jgi:hypothetical protein